MDPTNPSSCSQPAPQPPSSPGTAPSVPPEEQAISRTPSPPTRLLAEGNSTLDRLPGIKVKDPVPGIPVGSFLPIEDAPTEPICPFCDKVFKTLLLVRGHAYSRHGIRWESVGDAREPLWMTSLQPYHYMAFALREVYGLTWPQIGKQLKRAPKRLARIYNNSPIAQEYVQKLRTMMADPEAIARLVLQANSVNATVDYLIAMEWAKDAKDYRAVRDFTKDIVALGNPEGGPSGQEIHIHLDSGDLDSPRVRSSYKEVTDGVQDVEYTIEDLED